MKAVNAFLLASDFWILDSALQKGAPAA